MYFVRDYPEISTGEAPKMQVPAVFGTFIGRSPLVPNPVLLDSRCLILQTNTFCR